MLLRGIVYIVELVDVEGISVDFCLMCLICCYNKRMVVKTEYGTGCRVSAKGDMYSYGILVLEMVTGRKPTDAMFGEGLSLHKFCQTAIPEGITEIVDSRLLEPNAAEGRNVMESKIRECVVALARIGVECSAELAVDRMDIKDLVMELHTIKQRLCH